MSIQVLNIGGLLIGDKAVLLITANLPELVTLLISKNRIRKEGALAIANNLRRIKFLDLSRVVCDSDENRVEPEGALACCQKLR